MTVIVSLVIPNSEDVAQSKEIIPPKSGQDPNCIKQDTELCTQKTNDERDIFIRTVRYAKTLSFFVKKEKKNVRIICKHLTFFSKYNYKI